MDATKEYIRIAVRDNAELLTMTIWAISLVPPHAIRLHRIEPWIRVLRIPSRRRDLLWAPGRIQYIFPLNTGSLDGFESKNYLSSSRNPFAYSRALVVPPCYGSLFGFAPSRNLITPTTPSLVIHPL